MKKIFSLLLLFSFAGRVSAQSTPSFWDDPVNNPMTSFYLVVSFVFVVTLILLIVALYLLRVMNLFVRQAAEQRAKEKGIVYVPAPGLWQRLRGRLTRAVPVEKEETVMLDHNYDGIRELDNHLPPWWKWLFYATIIWGIGYLIVYHVTNSLPLSGEEYKMEVAAAETRMQELRASQPQEVIDEANLTYTPDPQILQRGKTVFNVNCTSCHRGDGGGNIGPNLTDDYWLHGGTVSNIYHTVKNGVLDKGMISWDGVLSPQQIRDVSFYVVSLHGSNPANPKAPQGELVKPAPAAADSTAAKTQASL